MLIDTCCVGVALVVGWLAVTACRLHSCRDRFLTGAALMRSRADARFHRLQTGATAHWSNRHNALAESINWAELRANVIEEWLRRERLTGYAFRKFGGAVTTAVLMDIGA